MVKNSGNAIISVFRVEGKKKLGSAYFFVKPGKPNKG
jgi:hypothetical protein